MQFAFHNPPRLIPLDGARALGFRLVPLLLVGALILGCSESSPSDGGSAGKGGATGNGGSSTAISGAGVGGNPGQGGGASGGSSGSGGQSSTGGVTEGGAAASGGAPATGGTRFTGGTGSNTGGARASGGTSTMGGKSATGGAPATGGVSATGGGSATGGSTSTGGVSATGGASATGGTGGASDTAGPCDIYGSANTPCVAAHSTVRALFGSYSGNLYQVRRASDKTTKDVAVLSPGGYANSATQDSFCAGTTCTISTIYDQSPKANHLKVTPPGGWLDAGGTEANATAAKVKVNGHTVYGVYTTGSFDAAVGGVGYRNNSTKDLATGDQPETMYMVASGKHYNQWCCFDYGNAETNNKDNGPGTMEAVYFGTSTQWGRGSGTGPWVMADLEDGVFGGQSFAAPATNTSIVADYVTAMLKGKAGSFALKGGDAQSGTLKTMYDGPRPKGYDPMKKEGAIILGIGGDNSHTGEGTFFEGCITAGYASDATDNAVQANIVAAGYGR